MRTAAELDPCRPRAAIMVPDRSYTRIAAGVLAALLASFAAAEESPTRSVIKLAQATSPEVAFWESIRDSDDPAEIEAYLKAYPNGQFAPLARIRLDKLKQAAGGAAAKDEPQEDQAESAPGITRHNHPARETRRES